MLTTALDLAGVALLVVAALLGLGLPWALAVAGVAALLLSWRMT